jgi:hypothetical protein
VDSSPPSFHAPAKSTEPPLVPAETQCFKAAKGAASVWPGANRGSVIAGTSAKPKGRRLFANRMIVPPQQAGHRRVAAGGLAVTGQDIR